MSRTEWLKWTRKAWAVEVETGDICHVISVIEDKEGTKLKIRWHGRDTIEVVSASRMRPFGKPTP